MKFCCLWATTIAAANVADVVFLFERKKTKIVDSLVKWPNGKSATGVVVAAAAMAIAAVSQAATSGRCQQW